MNIQESILNKSPLINDQISNNYINSSNSNNFQNINNNTKSHKFKNTNYVTKSKNLKNRIEKINIKSSVKNLTKNFMKNDQSNLSGVNILSKTDKKYNINALEEYEKNKKSLDEKIKSIFNYSLWYM